MIEFIGFSVSILGVVICARFVLPCFIIPPLSLTMENAEQSLAHAVATGAIPEESEHRVNYEMYASHLCNPRVVVLTHKHSLADQFARVRIDSHRSPGLFPQIWLAVRHGYTCKLYSLGSRVEALRLKVEVRWAALRCFLTTD